MTRNDESFEVSEKNFDVIVSHDVSRVSYCTYHIVSVRTPEIPEIAQGRRGFARRRRPRPGNGGGKKKHVFFEINIRTYVTDIYI